MFSKQKYVLTEKQRQIYASEKLINFRWIYKVLATHSRYELTDDADLAPTKLNAQLSELGQFAEVAYSAVPLDFVFQNISTLLQPEFPLEGYNALQDSLLLSTIKGSVGRLPVFVAYRPPTKQLVVAISGTSSLGLCFYDIKAARRRHPSGRGSVHCGFWCLYEGIKSSTIDAIKKGLQGNDINEIVITGHSMGGSVSYLLCLDLMADNNVLQPGLKIILAVFGAPRSGDSELVEYWAELKETFERTNGPDSIQEYSVKAYNDGVTALPPSRLGYRHYAKWPLYLVEGRLYRIPTAESEHAWFPISSNRKDNGMPPEYPLGGHNYYSGRDMERFIRRMTWLNDVNPQEDHWEERYRRHRK